VEDNVTVSGTATLKAGNNIHLKPEFHAPSGSNFTAKIQTVPNTPKRYYYLKDHLGSIRVVVDETGNIVSSDDYDPWGMILNGRSTDNNYNNAKYKFTGKERDVETGYDYFGARYYDSRIGRWPVVDPLFVKYPGISPYAYTLNNPIRFIDLEGKQVWEEVAAGAGALEIAGWAAIAAGVAISAIGSENTGRGIIEAGEWINRQAGSLINLIPDLTKAPTPFPITQGEGINQTTIAPSDVTSVSPNLGTLIDQGFTPATTLQEQSVTVGKTVEAKFEGRKVGVQTHIEVVGGKIHIQISGSKQKQDIDPTKPIREQVGEFVKGSKGNIQKIVENVEKGIKKLEELNK
jgi:RHS repeat-associated protein